MDDNDRRIKERITHRLKIFYGTAGTPYVGFIKNMSLSGLAIASRTVYNPKTVLNLHIKTEGSEIYSKGDVRWCNRSERPVAESAGMFDMGVRFIEYSREYEAFFNRVMREFQELRRDPRYEKVLKVTFNSPKELIRAFTQNISMGGFFIQTGEALALGSVIDVEIDLKDVNESVRVEGKVVFTAGQALADRIGIGPGVGVEILQYHEDGKARLKRYLHPPAAKS